MTERRPWIAIAAGVALATTLSACSSTPTETQASAEPPKPSSASTPIVDDFDASALLAQAKFVPYPAQGKREGFLVERVEPASAWTQVGLRPGDVVVAVGDKSVSDTATSFDLLRAVANPGSERIEVVRRSGGASERFALPGTLQK